MNKRNNPIQNLRYVYHPKKIADNVADRIRTAAKYFCRSIFKGSRQILWYLCRYLIHAPPCSLPSVQWTLCLMKKKVRRQRRRGRE